MLFFKSVVIGKRVALAFGIDKTAIFITDQDGFKNYPLCSWMFVKRGNQEGIVFYLVWFKFGVVWVKK